MYSKDTIIAKDGSEIVLTFYAHASVGIEWKGIHIYVDPVGERYNVNYAYEPKANLILVTHQHTDHLDLEAINLLRAQDTVICASVKCDSIDVYDAVEPHKQFEFNYIPITCIPAYNTTEDHLKYHPKENMGIGYIIELGGTLLYFAGDTEDNEDVLSLQNVDIAFLPVNQPYTMTIKQVVNVVKNILPKVVYPYHYGSQLGVTDVTTLEDELKGICEVRIRNMI